MFQNVVAIVSGGASGLGAATATYLVRHGARVLVADLSHAQDQFLKLEASSANFNGSSGLLKFAKTDVRSEDDISYALDMVEEEFGEQGQHITHDHDPRVNSRTLPHLHLQRLIIMLVMFPTLSNIHTLIDHQSTPLSTVRGLLRHGRLFPKKSAKTGP